LQWLLWDIYDILYRQWFLDVGVGIIAIVDDNFNRELLAAESAVFNPQPSTTLGVDLIFQVRLKPNLNTRIP